MSATKKPYFDPVDPKVVFPKVEEKILKFWKENKIFEKSVDSRSEDKKWTFLDGPPFVTGTPHYGSLLSSLPKDLFPRFWTMKGYRVDRVWGWDGHGLPIENKVETKLGVKRKKDIEEKVGVKKFIEECLKYVDQVSDEWEWYVDHVGRWVDFKNAYKTWDKDYMESVMWVFRQIYDKGFIYKGLRVSLFCPHCSTPISNFEVAMDADNYKELMEPANTYKYKVKEEENTSFLAWSTTPWNKIATPALAVNPKLTYVKVKQGNEYYILAKSTLKILLEVPKYQIVEEFKGSELLGKSFEPHYNYYEVDSDKKAFVIIGGDFVTADEGTGIVTIAAYGEDDLKAMQANNIQIVLHVDEEGMLKTDVPNWAGMYYLDVNPLVNKDLADRGLMYKEEQHTHTVPTCWRCHTRLLYAPQDAWYVDIQKLKPALEKNNKPVNWYPEHFKMGRFLKSVEAAPDWCISRSRYWGSPVPVWECECGQRFVPGSIKELEERSGKKVGDLHKPEIDEVEIKCDKCGKDVHRVPEVLDSWIEAGSASFAERHFPFEENLKVDDFFPPDFIVEYTGQIRAWFYVLHVISTAIYDTYAFKNVVVTGVILGTDGRKMSKNYGNYPDPKELIQKYGGDALRLYLMGASVMRGEDIRISEDDYRSQVRGLMLVLWNVYNYFVTYSNLEGWKPEGKVNESDHILDKWIQSLLNVFIFDFTESLENYDTPLAVNQAKDFVSNLSNWYVRRSRDRKDKTKFYTTFYEVLVKLSQVLAPIIPFMTEEMYKNLTKAESVHLADWPEARLITDEEKYSVLEKMNSIRAVVEWAHSIRKENSLRVRQPLSALWFFADDLEKEKASYRDYEDILKEELNVKNVKYGVYKEIVDNEEKLKTSQGSKYLDIQLSPELIAEGEAREIIRKIQDERKALGTKLDDKVNVTLPSWPVEHEDEIKAKALVSTLEKGEFRVERDTQ